LIENPPSLCFEICYLLVEQFKISRYLKDIRWEGEGAGAEERGDNKSKHKRNNLPPYR
jgi:hypothetical protein